MAQIFHAPFQLFQTMPSTLPVSSKLGETGRSTLHQSSMQLSDRLEQTNTRTCKWGFAHSLCNQKPGSRIGSRDCYLQDHTWTGRGEAKVNKNTVKHSYNFKLAFPWFLICLVAINVLLFSRVLTKFALTLSTCFLICLWKDRNLELPAPAFYWCDSIRKPHNKVNF